MHNAPDIMEKVVKCMQCGQYYTYTQEDTKCPFCHTEYDGVVEEEEVKEAKKKKTTTANKGSFELWKDTQ
jgi:Zn finger protein HypA/HybF involved in hydrogenase expression